MCAPVAGTALQGTTVNAIDGHFVALHFNLVCSLGLRAASRSVAFWPSSSYNNTVNVPTRCSLQSTALAVLPDSGTTELATTAADSREGMPLTPRLS